MAEPQSHNSAQLRKKRKKSRYVKQGYHKSERDDYRMIAARAFLLGITRDSHLREPLVGQQPDCRQASAAEENANPLALVVSPTKKSVTAPAAGDEPSPPSTPVLEARYFPTFKRPTGAEAYFEPTQLQTPQQLGGSKSVDQWLGESHHRLATGIRTSRSSSDYTDSPAMHSTSETSLLLHIAAKWPTTAEGAIYHHCLPNTQYYETGRSWRVVCTGHTQTVVSVSSVLPYYTKNIKSRHETKRERMRVRGNSFSLQMDLECVELGTTTEEVSLAFLLNSVWITPELPLLTSDLDCPTLFRRGSVRRSTELTESKRSSTPTPLARYLVAPEGVGGGDLGPVFRGDHRSPLAVILGYNPHFLNNDELFASPMTTTLTPPGYRVSIIEYARKADIKKGLNDRFKEIYPHVELSLTKLVKIKRKLYEVATEQNLDLAAVAYAYVYFEKLVLMGKVNESVRRPVAGVCLLLAAKFVLDLKKKEISDLIDEIADSFRLSSRELLLYEFPVLAVLQFSLLTPNHQAKLHHDKLLHTTN